MVFDFLTRFVEECETLEMTEPQAFIALPHFLTKPALPLYRAARSADTSTRKISAWPECVQYFLSSYATPGVIRSALNDLRVTTKKGHTEDELDYAARLNTQFGRCGNVHEPSEQMTIFIDGLNPSIRTLVARYREQQSRHDLTFQQLVQYARDEGEAYRARLQNATPAPRNILATPAATNRNGGRPRQALLLSQPATSHRSSEVSPAAGQHELLYIQEGSVNDTDGLASVPTSELPSTEDVAPQEPNGRNEDDPLLYGERRVVPYTPAPALAQQPPGMHRQRPGWVDTRSRVEPPPVNRGQHIICHACYGRGHFANECTLPFREFMTIIRQYEQLNEEEKKSTNPQSYNAAKATSRLGNDDSQPKN